MNRRVGYAVAWLAICIVELTVLVPINVPTYVRLLQHSKSSAATITQPDCANHARAGYRFEVHGSYYVSADTMPFDCRTLRPGDKIEIYYDTLNPTVSRAEDPRAGLANELVAIGLGCLLVPTLAVLGFAAWWRRSKRQNQSHV